MSTPTLELARCNACGGTSFPAEVPGCRHCGAAKAQLRPEACAVPMRLLNFATVYSPLAPGLEVPAVIGEVELAPGLVEEARIDVPDETVLALGMALAPVWQTAAADVPGNWVFRPLAREVNA
ncbi:zinc ribbon domain-containing protein [Variovorax paradoxus]|uniref:zinc ribbon domain-containing protein n=1 Tax=Variovorax paradoxus TaxID=34073 RepID=UPI0012D3C78E|nr:zinc ribbon domain-containing protein [Variovorax paradoxus]